MLTMLEFNKGGLGIRLLPIIISLLLASQAHTDNFKLPVDDVISVDSDSMDEEVAQVVVKGDGKVQEKVVGKVDQYGKTKPAKKIKPESIEHHHIHEKKYYKDRAHVDTAGTVTDEWRKENPALAADRIRKDEALLGRSQVQTYDVKQSGNIIIPIGHALLNRIQTPFSKVKVRTANDAEVFTEAGDVYVAVADERPLNLILLEDGVPDSAISVTLLPKFNTPPVMAHLHVVFSKRVEGLLRQAKSRNEWEGLSDLALAEGQQNDHVSVIKRMMKPLPMGKTPPGFNLIEDFDPAPGPCSSDLTLQEGQRLEGARHQIAVYLAKNLTNKAITFYEEACYQEQVLAVATYPREVVPPGGETEVYILKTKQAHEVGPVTRTRPSLLDH